VSQVLDIERMFVYNKIDFEALLCQIGNEEAGNG